MLEGREHLLDELPASGWYLRGKIRESKFFDPPQAQCGAPGRS